MPARKAPSVGDVGSRAVALAATFAVCARATGCRCSSSPSASGGQDDAVQDREPAAATRRFETMIALGEFFSVSIADLLGGDETPAIEVVRAGSEGVDISGTAVRGAGAQHDGGRDARRGRRGRGAPGLWRRRSRTARRARARARPPRTGHRRSDRPGGRAAAGDYATYLSGPPHRWGNPGRQDALLWVIHTFPRGANGTAEPALGRRRLSDAYATASSRSARAARTAQLVAAGGELVQAVGAEGGVVAGAELDGCIDRTDAEPSAAHQHDLGRAGTV